MKIFLLLILILCPSFSFAQTTKTVTINDNKLFRVSLKAVYETNETGKTDLFILFMAQDSRYQQLTEFIAIFTGTPLRFYSFVTEIENFYEENINQVDKDSGISKVIQGQTVSLLKVMGMGGVNIYEHSDSGNGHRTMTIKNLKKTKQDFEKWASKNNVSYN